MKFINGIISPQYEPCTKQRFMKWCSQHNKCHSTNFKATLGRYVDVNVSSEGCSATQLCNCGC